MSSSKGVTSQQIDPNRYPFWGLRIPKEVKYFQQACIGKIPNFIFERNCYRDLLKIAVSSLENIEPKFDAFQTIASQHNVNLNVLLGVYSGLLKLLKCALKKSSVKQEIIKEDLKELLKLPVDFVNDFATVIYSTSKRENIERCLVAARPRYPTLQKLDWRVDVSISTSSLMRTLEPAVLIKLKLSDNRQVSFEMNIKKFHLLRYNIATILKEIDDVESRQVFKLID